MTRKILAVLATIVALTFAAAAPAQAAVNGCPEASGYLCLHENINYGAGRWQVSFATANSVPCVNLNNSSYTSGNPVINTSASLTITPQSGAGGFLWRVHEDLNCAGNSRAFSADTLGQSSNLSYFSPTLYHVISSVSLCVYPYFC